MSRSLVSGIAALAAFLSVASAATINVDFNTTDGTGAFAAYSGTGAAPDLGTTWNGFAVGAESNPSPIGGATSGALVTSTGLSTTVTVSLGNFRAYEANEQVATLSPALMTDFAYQPNLGPGGPDSTFVINGLNPALTYDLYLLSQNGGYGNTATIFTIGGLSQIAQNDGNTNVFFQGTNYVRFSGLVAVGGTISGTYNDVAAANNAAFNGLQILEIVPEPAALSLVGLAGLLVLRRRRS